MSTAKTMGAVTIGATAPGKTLQSRIDDELAHTLNHLLHLGYDLHGAYKTALARIQDPALRESLEHLDDSHEGYLEALSTCVENLGKKATTSGDLHGILERGRVILGDLSGDQGILRAMAANEEEMCAAYKEALNHPGLPAEVSTVISRALAHETRHQSLYDQLLGRFVG
jgi:uncharacterized protein (TIGR02284 family)